MASKYIPPHARAAAAAAGGPAEPESSQSHLDWLKSQQSRYTVVTKTPEQLKAEFAAMTFEQLRSRAGPPPNIHADSYGGLLVEAETGDCGLSFNSDMGRFKRGQGPPPAPMTGPSRDDNVVVNAVAAMDGVAEAMDGVRSADSLLRERYCAWYKAWGAKLTEKWYQEHPRPAPKTKTTKPKTVVEETKGPSRGTLVAALEVSGQSGW